MFATFTIVTEEAARVLSLPDSAIQREGGKTIVFVAKGEGRFEKRSVELGPELQGWHVLRSGLQPGEQVVTKGAFVLKSETQKGLMEE
jgi:multidrug efflux pump subunit AcrA (membrane-fusion protein)